MVIISYFFPGLLKPGRGLSTRLGNGVRIKSSDCSRKLRQKLSEPHQYRVGDKEKE